MQTEHELMLHKELEELGERNQQCKEIERQLERMEDDVLWRNRRSKELNDDLFDSFPQDKKLQKLLLDREEMMEQRISRERIFFQEFRENIYKIKKETRQKMDDYQEELERVKKETVKEGKEDENNNNGYYA